jgi:phosphoribosylanthranilate isomerase
MTDTLPADPGATRRPLIKVCGITRQQDADACLEAGVDMLGFIFHPQSPRRVTPEQAAGLRTPGALRVGVFVNQTQAEVLRVMDRARLDLAQLCGDNDPAFCRAVGPGRVMRVFWPERHSARAALEDDLHSLAPVMAYALLDAGTATGGHGRAQDAERLHGLDCPVPWLLAGGLGPETLPRALAACAPAGYDLNSGLESAPGVKDHRRIRAAVALIRPRG